MADTWEDHTPGWQIRRDDEGQIVEWRKKPSRSNPSGSHEGHTPEGSSQTGSTQGRRENPKEAIAALTGDTAHRAANPAQLAVHENPNENPNKSSSNTMDAKETLLEGKDHFLTILGGAGLGVAGDAAASNAVSYAAEQIDPDDGYLAKGIKVFVPAIAGSALFLATKNKYVRSVGLGMGLTTVRNGVTESFKMLFSGSDEDEGDGSGDGDDQQDAETQGRRPLSSRSVSPAGHLSGRSMSGRSAGGALNGYTTDEEENQMSGGYATQEEEVELARGI